MKRFFVVLCIVCSLVSGCKTIDLEPVTEIESEVPPDENESDRDALRVEEVQAAIDVEKQIIYVEKPVYIPASDTRETSKVTGVDSVRESTVQGTVIPEQYSGAARIYDYNPDFVYEVYTQILRTTDIYLEPGELVIGEPFISDSERWIRGAGVSQANGVNVQHIYIKPKVAGIDATLIINTNRRVYHIILRSYNTVHMPMVKWKYIDTLLPGQYVQDFQSAVSVSSETEYADPRFLSFNYTIRFNVLNKPAWLPRRVYDDGKKTYIVMDEQVLQRELPGLFEKSNDIVNYRVKDNLLIIDKLIEKLTLKYDGQKITIEKKKDTPDV